MYLDVNSFMMRILFEVASYTILTTTIILRKHDTLAIVLFYREKQRVNALNIII